jgi:hypothetical protein
MLCHDYIRINTKGVSMFVRNSLLAVLALGLLGIIHITSPSYSGFVSLLSIALLSVFFVGVAWWDVLDRPGADPVRRFFNRLTSRL